MIHRSDLTHTLIKSSLYVSAIFFFTVNLIRSQPYDDSDLRTFFQFAAGCEMPCWYGIQLGSANLDSALSQLRGFPTVQSVTKRAGSRHIWEWNSARPTVITGNLPQYVFSWRDNIAETISVQNLTPLWKIWLIWGEPDEITISLIEPGQVLLSQPMNVKLCIYLMLLIVRVFPKKFC